MTPIRYVTGDATKPDADGPKIIAHVCNDLGLWGAGFVLAVSARWPEPRNSYLRATEQCAPAALLGRVDLVPVAPQLWVANMIAQKGISRSSYGPPIRYEALRECLRKLGALALKHEASVHMPRIGCGLAGGDWTQVEPMIRSQLSAAGVTVTVYDLAAPSGHIPKARSSR